MPRMRRFARVLGLVVLVVAVCVAPAVPAAGERAGQWRLTAAGNPVGATSVLSGVSCWASDACWAVGSTTARGWQGVLAERWNGVAWSLTRVPLPAGVTNAVLDSIACVAGQCIAVGRYHGSDYLTLVERWSDGRWSTLRSPNVANASDSDLELVSCGSSTSCVALGDYGQPEKDGSSTDQPLVESWNGARWTIVHPPLPASSVSCVGEICVAVGGKGSTTNLLAGKAREVPVAWIMRSGVWAAQAVPADKQPAGLGSVSCSSAVSCMAVGETATYPTQYQLVEHWNGARWSMQTAPVVSPNHPTDLSVSCAAADECTAVGSTINGETYVPIAEQWNGSKWVAQSPPEPPLGPKTAEADGTDFDAISCTPAGTCMAVGNSVTPTASREIYRAVADSYTP